MDLEISFGRRLDTYARLAPENALNDLEVEFEIIACPSRVHKGASDKSQLRPNYLLITE